jgi:FtsZ-interacting cell division protein ZipA
MDVDPPMPAAALPSDQPVIEPHQLQPTQSSSHPHPKQQQQQHQHKKKKQQQQQKQQQQSRKRFRPSNGQDAQPEPVIEYEIRDGLRHVKPYVYSFYARAKGRWWGRSILEVFQKVIGFNCGMFIP